LDAYGPALAAHRQTMPQILLQNAAKDREESTELSAGLLS
jgi:hypothetical protein